MEIDKINSNLEKIKLMLSDKKYKKDFNKLLDLQKQLKNKLIYFQISETYKEMNK